MRVIAGLARGRRLRSVKGIKTRPTSDRVKEAMFNILGNAVIDARVLDLFAGTGALAIEALSRGALSAVLVDNDPRAVAVINTNLRLTGLEKQAEVYCSDAVRALESLSRRRHQFDLVFLDPPYDCGLYESVRQALCGLELLQSGGILVVECRPSLQLSWTEPGLRLARQATYGDTMLLFYQREDEKKHE